MAGLFSLIFFASLILLLIGFFKPQTSLFWYGKERTKKKSAIIYGLVAFASMILIGAFADKSSTGQTSTNIANDKKPKQEISAAQKDSIAKAEKMRQVQERKNATVKASDLVAMYVQTR